MPSIQKVANWYAQSFEVFPSAQITRGALGRKWSDSWITGDHRATKAQAFTRNTREAHQRIERGRRTTAPDHTEPRCRAWDLPEFTLAKWQWGQWAQQEGYSVRFSGVVHRNRAERECRRYYATVDEGGQWPPEIFDYNNRFTKLLQTIKHRHDPVVTTMGMSLSRDRIVS
jgi:pyruvate dehydrogenase kinase 2/3/4